MPTITLRDDMRVGAVGRTRCGKTFAMERLLSQMRNVIVIDSKHRVNWQGYRLTTDPMAALSGIPGKVILRHVEKVPDKFWTRAMDILNEAGGGVIYIDEMPEIGSANFMPAGLRTVFRLGGELGVGVWWAGQESTGIPNTALRQSDVLLLFMNHGASDREKLIKTAGDMGEVTGHLRRFEFTIYESGGEAYDPSSIRVFKVKP
jgi:hypothetical protein